MSNHNHPTCNWLTSKNGFELTLSALTRRTCRTATQSNCLSSLFGTNEVTKQTHFGFLSHTRLVSTELYLICISLESAEWLAGSGMAVAWQQTMSRNKPTCMPSYIIPFRASHSSPIRVLYVPVLIRLVGYDDGCLVSTQVQLKETYISLLR